MKLSTNIPDINTVTKMNIQSSGFTSDEIGLEIVNSAGQVVKSASFSGLTASNQIDVSELKNGIYFLNIWRIDLCSKSTLKKTLVSDTQPHQSPE